MPPNGPQMGAPNRPLPQPGPQGGMGGMNGLSFMPGAVPPPPPANVGYPCHAKWIIADHLRLDLCRRSKGRLSWCVVYNTGHVQCRIGVVMLAL